jgi:hypothetical protein
MEVVWVVFIATNHILVSRTIRRKGPNSPRRGEFSKKLLLSGIIYGISDSRLRIEINRLMHLRINQLGKLVSSKDL